MKKKIAFVISAQELSNWSGGYSYFKNLFSVLKKINKFDYIIYTDSIRYLKNMNLDNTFKIKEEKIFKKGDILYFLRKIIIFFLKKDLFLYFNLLRDGISTLSHRRLFKNKKIKIIGWIPDLQHRVKSSFFDKKYLFKREKYVSDEIKNTNKIFVSSNQIKKEFIKYYEISKNIIPLRISSETEFKKKKLKNFILFPAQFWEHKNHKFLINVAKIIKKKKLNIKIIFCGKTENYKNKNFYNLINKKINKGNLGKIIINLGEVNLEKLNTLQDSCLAFVNPSFYEGWSTINEEARSKKKYIFLSDIPGHREQNNPGSIFFDLNDPKGFFKKLKNFVEKKNYIKNFQLNLKSKKYSKKNFQEIRKIILKEYV